MPIRSPRRLYLISKMTRDVDDDPNVIDKLPGGSTTETTRPVIAKIKESIGDWLGFSPLAYDDPLFTATFGGSGLNQGAVYRKRFGGFKDASYILVAKTNFLIKEKFYDDSGVYQEETNSFKTMSIGFPKGHSVTEVINWLELSEKLNNIRRVITPAGVSVDLFTSAANN